MTTIGGRANHSACHRNGGIPKFLPVGQNRPFVFCFSKGKLLFHSRPFGFSQGSQSIWALHSNLWVFCFFKLLCLRLCGIVGVGNDNHVPMTVPLTVTRLGQWDFVSSHIKDGLSSLRSAQGWVWAIPWFFLKFAGSYILHQNTRGFKCSLRCRRLLPSGVSSSHGATAPDLGLSLVILFYTTWQ